MSRKPLSPSEIKTALGHPELAGWSLKGGKLHREFKFGSFPRAFGFMAAAALIAQQMDHHPEWSNVYDRVVVDLSTHDAGGVTDLDVKLAEEMTQLAA